MSGGARDEVEPSAMSEAMRARLVETDEDGRTRLIGGRCRRCDRHQFPLEACCPYCGAGDEGAIERVHLSDRGELWGWTSVLMAPPGYRGRVPFGFGVVELPEGIRIVTRLSIADPERLAFGTPMELMQQVLHADDRDHDAFMWCFTPAAAE
jgi:uncharacterized OB-fold protein